jgi:hypothetical protein
LFCNQQRSSDGAEDAFVLHFLYLVPGQTFRGQGAFYFRALALLVLGRKIKGLASPFKEQACVRDYASAGHWVKDKVAGFCEIVQGVGNELGRDTAGPVVPESFIAFVKTPLVPGAKAPSKLFKFFLICLSL